MSVNPRMLYFDVVDGRLTVQNEFPDAPVRQGAAILHFSPEAVQHTIIDNRKKALELMARRLSCSGKTTTDQEALLNYVEKLLNHGGLINRITEENMLLNQASRDLPVNVGYPTETTLKKHTLRFEKT